MYCIVNVFVWSSPLSVTPGAVTGLAVFTVNVNVAATAVDGTARASRMTSRRAHGS